MNSKFGSSLLMLAAGGLMLAGSASAQTATPAAGPGVVDPGHPRVNQVDRREGRQQKRIANGVKNGTLTPEPTAHLAKREAGVPQTGHADMAKHNGQRTKG